MLEIDVENLSIEEWRIFWGHICKALQSFDNASREEREAVTVAWFRNNFEAGYNLVRR